MRVRPFFWAMLAIICVGIVIFAETVSLHRSFSMAVHIEQIAPVATDAASIRLRLTDSEGLPIEQASITSHTSMPAMRMVPQQMAIEPLGQGVYLAHLRFSMIGAWNIEIIAHADGFAPVYQSLALNL